MKPDSYTFDVKVSDGQLSNTKTLTVDVTNVDENTVVELSDINQNANEIDKLVTSGTAGITANVVGIDTTDSEIQYSIIENQIISQIGIPMQLSKRMVQLLLGRP